MAHEAQAACNAGRARLCRSISGSYYAHQNAMSADVKKLDSLRERMREQAKELSHDGCGRFAIPNRYAFNPQKKLY